MSKYPKEGEEFPLKEEVHHHNSNEKEKASSSTRTLSSSQWPRLKDPRIVRVSRAFGGKDRHSKVYTIRGLRDRRVRLSIPTAIQLYDLQDRLGLNQPSKVVDWLINVAKDEINQLPPLPNFPTLGTNFNFGFPSSSNQTNINNSNNFQYPNFQEEENNIKQGSAIVLANNNNLLQKPNHPSFLSLLNSTMPSGNSNFYQWGVTSNDIVNYSQLGNNGFITNQTNYVNAMEMDNHHHQNDYNHQMLSSSSSSQNPLNNSNSLKNHSFSLDIMSTPKFLQGRRESSSNKEQDFNPK